MKVKMSIVLVFILFSMWTISASAAQQLFQPYVSFPLSNAQAVGIGDFNGDGFNDVAITNSSQLFIYTQSNTGSLVNTSVYDAGSRPESLAVGDLNNDGRTDIVLTNFSSNTISVFLQQMDGTLTPRVTFPTSTGPDAVAVGDVNSDGLDDIAVSHWNASNIGIFTQLAGGTLNSMIAYSSPQAGYDDIEIADINNDGKNDVIKMNGQGYVNPHLSVYLQNAAGTLNSAISYSIGCSSCLAHGVGAGDLTGDGLADVVVSYGGNQPSSQLAVFVQSATGSLQPSVSYAAYDIPEPVEVADVNLDGRADALTLHGGWYRAGVFLQQNGALSPYSLYAIPYASHYKSQGFDVGDINNDGLPDLAIADYNNGLVVLYHAPQDITLPTISVTAVRQDNTPYAAGSWTNQTVTVKFTCSDADSGVASCPSDQVFSMDGVTPLVTGVATDRAGNSASVSFGPINIDKTPPSLSVSVSPNPVVLKGAAQIVTSAGDNLSGAGSVSCSNVDTNTVGAKSLTCNVADNAGNAATKSVSYQVIYKFVGFLQPIVDCVNNPCSTYQISSFTVGTTIAVKFQLKDANGTFVQPLQAPLWLVPLKMEGTPPVTFPDNYVFQTSGASYTWKRSP
ncbi:MAG TPA: VCBS repeat-containing protein, partial [Anaerolineales bacterium]|nr:VCBS repeat-containing protein [Anaerolineales bacterium]